MSLTSEYCERKRQALSKREIVIFYFLCIAGNAVERPLGSLPGEFWSTGVMEHAQCIFPTELAWFVSLILLCDALLLHTVSCCP